MHTGHDVITEYRKVCFIHFPHAHGLKSELSYAAAQSYNLQIMIIQHSKKK